ncbi:hypothetical protein ACLOJK_007769 [Asimina triloba]
MKGREVVVLVLKRVKLLECQMKKVNELEELDGLPCSSSWQSRDCCHGAAGKLKQLSSMMAHHVTLWPTGTLLTEGDGWLLLAVHWILVMG